MRKTLVALVFLALIALGADRGGAFAASSYAANHAASESAADHAHVTIHGFPFLTQVAGSDLTHITVTERGIHRDGLTIDRLQADAYGVHLSFADAVRGQVTQVPIDRVTGSAVITYATLTTTITQRLGLKQGVTLSLAPRDTNDLTATATGPLGLHLSFAVPVPSVANGDLQLGDLAQRLAPVLPDQAAAELAIPLPPLPYGLRLSTVSAQDDGLHLAVTGDDVTVTR